MLNNSSPVDPLLHSLADPTRRGIVEHLTHGPAAVSSIAERLPMSLQAVMQHITILQAADVVRTEKIGRIRTVSLNPAALRQLERWICDQRIAWERRFDQLDALLNETPKTGKD